jgi:hypothetical protein
VGYKEPPRCDQCGAIDRNAQLATLLRHVIGELHRVGPDHTSTYWTQCRHVLCVQVTALLKTARIRPV